MLAGLVVAFLEACRLSGDAYTLYRTSPGHPGARVHVATFDATQGEDYNRENCAIAAKLFAEQPGVSVRYWCEKGAFRN